MSKINYLSDDRAMAYHLTTAGRYDFYEVASALQKAIRRGHEEEAMY
jgi:hypothetical protein